MENRERLIEAGWKQGTLLSPEDNRLSEGANYSIPSGARLLVVSQTCDLVQGSFENEPYFEVLCLRPLGREPSGEYLGGKNSRRLEFSLDLEGQRSHWYALPHERHPIDRKLLLDDLDTGPNLDGEHTLKMILQWLTRRYTRPAFPETFVQRMAQRKRNISQKFSRLNPFVCNVLIGIDTLEELGAEEEYMIEVILLMEPSKFDDPSKYQECEQIRNDLERQLDNCDGITVTDITIESTASITIEEVRGFYDWDYSYMTFREDDEAAMPVDLPNN